MENFKIHSHTFTDTHIDASPEMKAVEMNENMYTEREIKIDYSEWRVYKTF